METQQTPLRPCTATWNTRFPPSLSLDLSLLHSKPIPKAVPAKRPALRLPTLLASNGTTSHVPVPNLGAPSPIESQNTPPRERGLTTSTTVVTPPTVVGMRRTPSFPIGHLRAAPPEPSSCTTLSSSTLISTSSSSPAPMPAVPDAPSPFLARHYPTRDARTRFLAKTLLNRIHAVGRQRNAFSTSCRGDGYESEGVARAYMPSRLSVSVIA
ncbi:hypothetical protein C8J57DRAFT_1275620 [Mycena rebaudengoi]|nr:hypothetical protein C8J57DRAFT_1275620 [Mycena rebaudengoi]